MLELETWSEISLVLLLTPPVLYAVMCYGLILRGLVVRRTHAPGEIRDALVNATGPIIGVALYLLVVGGPFLGMVSVVDRITDA